MVSVMITGSHNPPEYNGFKITLNKDPFLVKRFMHLGREILSDDSIIEDNEISITIDSKNRYINYIVNHFLIWN